MHRADHNRGELSRAGHIKILAALVVCAFTSCVLLSAERPSFSFTAIDFPLFGTTGQSALAINDRGQIVGQTASASGKYLFDRGEFTQITADAVGVVRGINNRDEISGFGGFGGKHGFLFDLHRGTGTQLDVPGANLTEAIGLNDQGEVVGDYRDATTGRFDGFLWRSGTFNVIDFPGATGTGLQGINNRGQIVGFYNLNNNPNGDTHGFLYEFGQFTTIDIKLPGALQTVPYAINDSGEIVGLYVDNQGNHGFVLKSSEVRIIDFPIASVTSTLIVGVNNAGTIVGTYAAAGVAHGFAASSH
jgi:uncharacterized membrane protein